MRITQPKTIGRYEIIRELGRGMMGIVYEARDPVLGRTLALKTIQLGFSVLPQEQESYEKRFMAEAAAAARLQHPGIVVVYDVGKDDVTGGPYMALEYLHGQTLDKLLRNGKPLEWRRALRIGRAVAEALHHAHSHRIIHRDIKPANIMLLESGDPKIMDFGIAKLPASQLTAAGQVFGSPSYMSPERAREEGVDARSDIFSLGAVLYELLTGRRAFPGQGVAAILLKVASEDPEPPSRLVRALPEGTDEVVARALAKKPTDRYPDGRTLAEDLQDLLEGQRPRHVPPARPAPTLRSAQPMGTVLAMPKPVGSDTDRGQHEEPVSFPPGTRVSLAILEGPRSGEVFKMPQPRVVIGRRGGNAGALLELDDPEVSRTHAVLACHGKQIVLRDLDSTNGTFVDDRRIEEVELEDKMEFRIGRTRLMLILASED
jgi:serine/threonine protein kinase